MMTLNAGAALCLKSDPKTLAIRPIYGESYYVRPYIFFLFLSQVNPKMKLLSCGGGPDIRKIILSAIESEL